MGQLTLTCGKWIYQETRWLFGVDKKKESKVIEVNDRICYEDFVQMVIREYKVDTQNYKVELSYMYPKKVLLTLPQNTPPIDIGNQRQFSGFLEQLKTPEPRLLRVRCFFLYKTTLFTPVNMRQVGGTEKSKALRGSLRSSTMEP
ncbi:hypothetical protein F2Q69_00048107 [Brassica cretica]|uniref:Uncharacterized protein n=1 Tax=Brassica cretica TaxID=69181 RepID=A0A8S9Q110_BRACR|nr:hypothetical protein F2Q69_00048107 [Brassica cretica]